MCPNVSGGCQQYQVDVFHCIPIQWDTLLPFLWGIGWESCNSLLVTGVGWGSSVGMGGSGVYQHLSYRWAAIVWQVSSRPFAISVYPGCNGCYIVCNSVLPEPDTIWTKWQQKVFNFLFKVDLFLTFVWHMYLFSSLLHAFCYFVSSLKQLTVWFITMFAIVFLTAVCLWYWLDLQSSCLPPNVTSFSLLP